MKNLFFSVLFILSQSALAETNLREFLFQKFDSKISKALEAKTIEDVVSILGKPSLKENSSIYYELEDFKYAFSAKSKNGKLTGIFYHPRKTKVSFIDLEVNKLVDKSKIRPVKKNGEEDGLSREYVDKKLSIRLVFKTDKEMSLQTVEVLK